MACGLGLLPEDCAADHIAPALGLRCTKRAQQWSGPCPVCGGTRCLSLAVKAGRLVWCCHREPACSKDAIREALTIAVPSCIPRHPRRAAERLRPIRAEEIWRIIDDRGMSHSTMRLRLALLASPHMTAREAAAKLGVSRAVYYRAVADVGRGRD
jgi:hypothetical protein